MLRIPVVGGGDDLVVAGPLKSKSATRHQFDLPAENPPPRLERAHAGVSWFVRAGSVLINAGANIIFSFRFVSFRPSGGSKSWHARRADLDAKCTTVEERPVLHR